MEKYRIVSRYEWYSNSGITWTNWFQVMFTPISDSEEELKPFLKKQINLSKDIDKRTKRRTEYAIEKFDYVPFNISEIKNKPKAVKTRKKKK